MSQQTVSEEDIQHIIPNETINDLTSNLDNQIPIDKSLTTKELLGFQDVTDGNDDIHKLVNELTSDINIEGKTDLQSGQIVAFSRAAWFGERYNSKNMKDLLRYLHKYLQSKDRGGRKELVESISSVFKYQLEKAKNQEKVEV